jgi:predicted SnoaL-like aldol condensation-catalyzing enzyme
MNLKEIAITFLKTAAQGSPNEAFDKYVASDFIHHNQYFDGDKVSLLDAMIKASGSSPNKSFSVKSSVQEGDRVVTYSHVVKENMDIAVFHMFRFKDDKIVELWDVGQQIAKDSPNKNGMF